MSCVREFTEGILKNLKAIPATTANILNNHLNQGLESLISTQSEWMMLLELEPSAD